MRCIVRFRDEGRVSEKCDRGAAPGRRSIDRTTGHEHRWPIEIGKPCDEMPRPEPQGLSGPRPRLTKRAD
ncbi:MAG: hypothetical protein EA381_12950 [Planctomycetaceae bacterium]|nr:MAG: hypothetical protein EA381_12950 [Planctomycetaceae bacterium]